MRTFIEWIVRRRIPVVAWTALVTVGLLLQVRHLEIIVDPDQLLPQEHPYIVATNIVEQVFGTRNTVVVGMSAKSGDVLNAPMLGKLKNLTEALANTPGAVRANVRSLASPKVKNIFGDDEGMSARAMMATIPKTDPEFAALARMIANNPVFEGVLISRDRRTAAIVAEFRKPSEGFGVVETRVESAIAPFRDDTVELFVTGQSIYLGALERYSARMAFLLPLAILVIGLMHYEAFRTLQGLILPLVTALLAVVWGLGIMILSGLHQLDPFSNATPILIIAVAAGHAVQILKRYYESYHAIALEEPDLAKANRLAVVEAVSAIGPVMVAAGGIAAASFLSLIVFDIQSIRTFGMFAAAGILSALAIELTFIPAIRAMLPPPGRKAFERESSLTLWDRAVSAAAGLVLGKGRGAVIGVSLLVAAVAGFGATLVVNDNSLRSFFTDDQPFQIADAALNERLAGTNTLHILIEGEQEEALKSPAVLQAMLATQRFLEQDPLVGATVSIADFVARMNRAMHGDDPAHQNIPESRDLVSQYLLLYSMSGDAGDFDDYVDPAYRKAVIQAFVKTDSSAHVAALSARLVPFLAAAFPHEFVVRLAGSITTPTAMSDMIVEGKMRNVAQIALVVFAAGSLLFRSVVAGLLLLTPLVMVALVNFGLMGFTGIPLQVATATIAALAIGVGADYAIYFTYRLREELRGGGDLDAAVRRCYATAGKASLYVASAVGGGYAVLVLSYGFQIHLWVGVMIPLAMLAGVISALTLYPALLLSLRPHFVFGPALEPRPVQATATTSLAVLLGLGSLLVAPTTGDAAGDDEALELMRRSFAVTRFADTAGDATFVLIGSDGSRRERKAVGLSKLAADGSNEARLTRFETPSDLKGTVVLSVEHSDRDDDIWVYLPALRKVRRIAAGQKRDAFVGTEFSYGDVIGYPVAEWTHRLLREETIDGVETAVVESLPADETIRVGTGYSRRVSWVRRDNFCVVKGELYDESNVLLKTYEARDFRVVDPVGNVYHPDEVQMSNVQNGRRSLVRYTRFEVNRGVSSDLFTPQAIESGQ